MPLHYSKAELKKLFNTRLKRQLEAMEIARVSLRNRTIIYTPIGILLFLLPQLPSNLIGKISLPFSHDKIVFTFIIFAIISVYLTYRFFQDKKAYSRRYKKNILEKVFSLILPEADFQSHDYISSSDYDNSRIFTASYNRYHGEDLLIAKYKGCPFKFSEVHTRHVSGSGKNRKERTIFKGIFFKASIPLVVTSNLVIIPDILNKLLGSTISGFLEDINFSRDKIVRLESPEFEKVFAIYGTDQIEARRILTPSIMEKILKYNTKTHKDISLSIQGGSLYMAVPFHKNLFEPRIWSPTRFADIVEVCDTLEILTEVIDHFEHIKAEVA